MTKLIAKERFYYGGRNVEAGEEFEADQQDVGLLTNSVSPRARVHDPRPSPPKKKPEPVETRTEMPEVSPDLNPEEPVVPVRRRYLRRDLRSED